MALLDRLRPQPAWKHSDPAMRVNAVESLPDTEQALLSAIARDDDSPRVRRAALARLAVVAPLAAAAGGDADEQVRADAAARLIELATGSESASLAQEAALAIQDERQLAQVARQARDIDVARVALGRLSDGRAVASVARLAPDDGLRHEALQRVQAPAELEAIALNTEYRDTGIAIVERLDDPAALERIAERARNKAVAKRARALIREREAAQQQARAHAQARLRKQVLLCEALDALEKSRDRAKVRADATRLFQEWESMMPAAPEMASRFDQSKTRIEAHLAELERAAEREEAERVRRDQAIARRRELIAAAATIDGADWSERVAALRAEWAALETAEGPAASSLSVEIDRACDAVARRAAARQRLHEVRDELQALALQAAAISEEPDLDAARPRWTALAARWRQQSEGLALERELYDRFHAAEQRWHVREEEIRARTAHQAAEHQRRLQQLAETALALTTVTEPSLRDLDHAIRDIRAALDTPGPFSSPALQESTLSRLKALVGPLSLRLRELRETDDWRRWANAGIQEELCKRVEALRDLRDLHDVARQVRDLRRQWKAVSAAPRDGDVLWQRFKTAIDEAQARCDEYFGKLAVEHAANVARKQAICEQAEALANSSDWIQTADTLKRLQVEWNGVGPGPKEQTTELTRRFRAACDTFFTRRKTDLSERKHVWAENAHKKEALCARAEELAASTDWANALNGIKQLQAEWKSVGPVRKHKSEALWKRFRAACDAFFERYGKRHEIEQQHRTEERDAACRALEALVPALAPASGEAPWIDVQPTAPRPNELKPIEPQPTELHPIEPGSSDAASMNIAASATGIPSDAVKADGVPAEPASPEGVSASPEGASAESGPAESVAVQSTPSAAPASGDDATGPDIPPREVPVGEATAVEPAAAAAASTATAASLMPPEGLLATVDRIWHQWKQAPGLPPNELTPFRERFDAALGRVLEAYPDTFRGTRFDLEAARTRRRALCDEVEALAAHGVQNEAAGSPAEMLAARLKESLAANTIGGRVNEEAKTRAATDRVRRAQQAWRDLGPLPGEEGRQLEARFQRACRRFFEQHPQLRPAPPPRPGGPPPRPRPPRDERR